jgi:hypothetical protein
MLTAIIIILILLWALGLIRGVGGNWIYVLILLAFFLYLFGR